MIQPDSKKQAYIDELLSKGFFNSVDVIEKIQNKELIVKEHSIYDWLMTLSYEEVLGLCFTMFKWDSLSQDERDSMHNLMLQIYFLENGEHPSEVSIDKKWVSSYPLRMLDILSNDLMWRKGAKLMEEKPCLTSDKGKYRDGDMSKVKDFIHELTQSSMSMLQSA